GWRAWLSQSGLLARAALDLAAGVCAVLRRAPSPPPRRRRLVGLVAGGRAAALAYGLNLLLTGLLAEVRPCHLHDIVSACPPPDNWSFPSNHTVIAFALAVGLAAAAPRLAWPAV